jgi:hypothetical protein
VCVGGGRVVATAAMERGERAAQHDTQSNGEEEEITTR